MSNSASPSRHDEATTLIAASPAAVFAHLDDQTRLAEHMAESSAMMGGGRMTYEFDGAKGRAVGSHIRMGGSAFGIKLFVEEVITERDPPRRKVWRTIGDPALVVVGAYQMGFEIEPTEKGSRLRVWIDYLPPKGVGRYAPSLGGLYARWCVGQMANDAARRFGADVVSHEAAPAA